MEIFRNALLKAGGLALAAVTLLTGCGYGVNWLMGFPPGSVPSPDDFSANLTVVSLCMAGIGYLMLFVYGAAYGWFARRDDEPLELGNAALGGALIGLVVAIYQSGLASISIALTFPQMQQTFAESGAPFDATPFLLLSLVGGFCVALVLDTALAAIGAAVYAALTDRAA
jgi:hypothetical protein